MKRRRRIILAIAVALIGVCGWLVYATLDTARKVPEAYAAWDAGTLLVEYMERHDGAWPRSWDDLVDLVATDAERRILLRGAQAGDIGYVCSLRECVRIDWTFDPDRPGPRDPVTRPDGGRFAVVWDGAEPNEMVRRYVAGRPRTRPTTLP